MKTFLVQTVALSFVVFSLASHAHADLILGLQAVGSTTVNSGDFVEVDLVITDTIDTNPLATEGLFAGGGRILKTAGTAVAGLPIVTDIMNYWSGPFDDFNSNPASSGGGVELGKVSAVLDFFALAGAGVGSPSITIARFTFQITGAAGETIQMTADRLNLAPTNTNETFGPGGGVPGTQLDDLITSFGDVTFTISGVAAVPEPASMVLASLTLAVAGGGSYLRRRRAKTAVSVKP